MPPIWCRLDRLWFGHPGILEGTLTRQPFICPLDHVFEVTLVDNLFISNSSFSFGCLLFSFILISIGLTTATLWVEMAESFSLKCM